MKKTFRMMSIALVAWLSLSVGVANSTNLVFTDNTASGGNYDAVFGNSSILGAFTDHWTFGLTPAMAGPGGGSIISGVGFGQTFGPNVAFSSFQLIDLTDNVVVASAPMIFDFTAALQLTPLNTSHDFDLVVMGDLNPGFNSGSYAGNLSISPVPEPETYAMLLVGLGLVSFAARRRTATLKK